ncbi:hypothetical protein SDC9_92892 [bioreactor metagenome]|uniref:Bacterial Pleckstrin homology domain-containing protein n=1 Tax=bioreactor metagenome TaxID=1076179 RepID=A0A645A8Y2_9ZZZZ|nr:hypothetical protein [Christensenella sp.]
MKIRAVRLQTVLIKYILAESFSLLFLAVLLIGAKLNPNESLLPVLRIILMLFLLVVALYPVYSELFGSGAIRFEMDETGVTYRKRQTAYHLDWPEIKCISLNPDLLEQLTKRCYICFFAADDACWLRSREEFSEQAFGVQYRKGLPEAIAKYTDLEICNLNAIQPEES